MQDTEIQEMMIATMSIPISCAAQRVVNRRTWGHFYEVIVNAT